jgi:hypothetical protein
MFFPFQGFILPPGESAARGEEKVIRRDYRYPAASVRGTRVGILASESFYALGTPVPIREVINSMSCKL